MVVSGWLFFVLWFRLRYAAAVEREARSGARSRASVGAYVVELSRIVALFMKLFVIAVCKACGSCNLNLE